MDSGTLDDDVRMDSTDPIFRQTCTQCERPALTFDEDYQPLCSRHASVVVKATRAMEKDDDDWWNEAISGKAAS